MKFGDAKSVVEIIGLMREAVKAEMQIEQPPGTYGRGPVNVEVHLPHHLCRALPDLEQTIQRRIAKEVREEAELRLQDRVLDLAAGLKAYDVEFGQAELDALRKEMRAERVKEMGGISGVAAAE